MSKLELLIRENKGRKERAEYTRMLSEVLNLPILLSDFVDLETTDKLTKDFYEEYKKIPKSKKKVYGKDDRSLK